MTGSSPEQHPPSAQEIVDGIIDVNKAARQVVASFEAAADSTGHGVLVGVLRGRMSEIGIDPVDGESSEPKIAPPKEEKRGPSGLTRADIIEVRAISDPRHRLQRYQSIRERNMASPPTQRTDPEKPVK